MKEKELINILKRTVANCEYYEKNNMQDSLLNEIGVLRGVWYCLEALNICINCDMSILIHFIEIQQQRKKPETNIP